MRHIGRQAMKLSKAERDKRHKLGMHNIQQPKPDEIPVLEPLAVVGVSSCRVCGRPSDTPFVVCVLCHNCQYCGFYNNDDDVKKCYYCGNYLPEHKLNDTIEPVTLNVNVSD
jgi:hypothetical protein